MMADPELVVFEAVIKAEQSLFNTDSVTPDNIDRFRPHPERAVKAAKVLEGIGFTVRHIGTFSVSGEGPRGLWEKTFGTKVKKETHRLSESHAELGEVKFWSHIANTPFEIPSELSDLVDRAYPQLPPLFFAESPLPPRVGYHHLRVPSDVATVLRAVRVHKQKVTGAGVLVAMADTGFYKHPFYEWHAYNYNATLAPDAIRVEHDEVGHGTAEAANIFSCAPDIDFVGVKMGLNATLAFKTASDLHPAVMTNSWGYDLRTSAGGPSPTLPNYLKPLEAAVIEAVRERGITVCFSGGNGHYSFPGQMPQVIAVGGVFAEEMVDDVTDDFLLKASDYASSFDSLIYPGRHVPDVCGLVGLKPRGIYIMLPVEPGDQIDVGLAGGTFPNGDETGPNDGWGVISGTSAASPQIAGVCALLKQVQPGLGPDLVKAILRASARDVGSGVSAHGQPAGEGHDGATGAGLVDALAAYKLARSVTIRNVNSLPAPR
jgi:subtilisin family serine protease